MIRTIKPKIRRCRTSCRTLKLFVRASFRSLQFHFVALRVVCFAGSSAPLTELISTRGRHNSRIGEHQLSFREQTAGKIDATKARLSRVAGPLDKTACETRRWKTRLFSRSLLKNSDTTLVSSFPSTIRTIRRVDRLRQRRGSSGFNDTSATVRFLNLIFVETNARVFRFCDSYLM